ncbi:phage gp6-like head-tail connector protein [Streptomyces sp. 3MP-14]|uniref:Phage gp6-like head-tail connector protein n=1 Tax=Streptomyces mimosae TaxID=2586635 RepID=A0A5N6A2C7_9ACTN|nr:MULTISPECIES: phage head-tail connector protein [Streptomyces]KAB8162924.1 phage gp6-like head-tail connector protein [Streptomyces mimosae]KAB8179137.1 phage gp6-like head-tail connector protein [Streptomyces sp. 3MP-14]
MDYADLATLKSALHIAPDDTSADALLNSAVASASRSIDVACGRRFWLDDEATERVFSLRGRLLCSEDGERLLVDDIGADDITVETGGAGGWTPVNEVDLAPDNAVARGRPVTALIAGGWAGPRVRITARWGWPAVPDDIRQAALIQAQRLYRRKDSPEGVTGSAEWGVVRLSRRDPDVWSLIEHYQAPGFG